MWKNMVKKGTTEDNVLCIMISVICHLISAGKICLISGADITKTFEMIKLVLLWYLKMFKYHLFWVFKLGQSHFGAVVTFTIILFWRVSHPVFLSPGPKDILHCTSRALLHQHTCGTMLDGYKVIKKKADISKIWLNQMLWRNVGANWIETEGGDKFKTVTCLRKTEWWTFCLLREKSKKNSKTSTSYVESCVTFFFLQFYVTPKTKHTADF